MTGVRAPERGLVRLRLRVEGTVQGVGFRPYVYRLAHELGLTGFVLNDSSGVVIEVEGPPWTAQEFSSRVADEAPPLAILDRVRTQTMEPTGEPGFRIAPSLDDGTANAPVAPDTATCQDCLRELFDPSDRRFRYPFINCTNCGPRFTIVRGVPYDRPLTTMAGYRMCPACREEYEDPLNRRFHAQPNACPACGPEASLVDSGGRVVAQRDAAVTAAVKLLGDGGVLAVKGLGGFHLACLASRAAAVDALRARKRREDKPFALMARNLESARALIDLTTEEEALLASRRRPIVIARRRPEADVAEAVAPRSRDLGVMLPYSPLHHLLLSGLGQPLVMTSGNVSDEPIAYVDRDALERLSGIADLFLLHDRPIQTRTDDSVLRAVAGRSKPVLIRRSRGYAPASIPLPVPAPRPVLACGAELKNTFCLAKAERAWVSHHIGDLENYETLRSFSEGIEHYQRLFDATPEIIAHDLHPEYLSTKFALDHDGQQLLGIQHHHAHLAACLAEHGHRGPAVGAIFDGTGYGTDGTIWGGELLVGDLEGFERVGHLWPVPLPGGAQAVREPWRMAASWLLASHGDQIGPPPTIGAAVDRRSWHQVSQLAGVGLASPTTTSMGRLFDAVAALCGLRMTVNYEGQAATELEAACDPGRSDAYPLAVADGDGGLILDARETVLAVLADVEAGAPVGSVAARFHGAVAAATTTACIALAARHDLDVVVLSGGSFQNRVLLERATHGLEQAGLRVLIPELLPPNDGGISYGQAAIAAAVLR